MSASCQSPANTADDERQDRHQLDRCLTSLRVHGRSVQGTVSGN